MAAHPYFAGVPSFDPARGKTAVAFHAKDDVPEVRFVVLTIGPTSNSLENQKRLLVELLDKKQLYVSLSEIDDAHFKVSKEDKALNTAR